MLKYLLHSAKVINLFILIALILPLSVSAKNKLDSQYANWERNLSTKPHEVLSALNQSFSKVQGDPYLLAQHHFLYSATYTALTFPDKALEHADKALALIPQSDYPWFYHKIIVAKVIALDFVGDPQQALPLINRAIDWATRNNNKWLLVEALSARGHIYNALSFSINALNDFQKAYNMVPEKGGEINQGDIANDIALVYEYRNENKLSVPFFEQAVAHYREQNNFLELSVVLYGLGRANYKLGHLETGQQQLKESARLARKVKDFQGEAYALKELAGLAFKKGDSAQAIQMLQTTYQTFIESNNKFMLIDTSFSLSRIYLSEGKIKLAEQYLAQAYNYLDAEAMPLQSLAINELNAKILAYKGEYQQAYEKLLDTTSRKQKIYSNNKGYCCKSRTSFRI